ncbi:hypothetical protein [Streptomyces sp. NPDC055607]
MKKSLRCATTALLVSALVQVGASGAAHAQTAAPSGTVAATRSTSPGAGLLSEQTGQVAANTWKKAVWGAGWFTTKYSVRLVTRDGVRPTGQYRCYTNGVPSSSGEIRQGLGQFTLSAYLYAECWIWSPVDANYAVGTPS